MSKYPVRQKDLAASIGIEGPSLVRLIDTLVIKGLIQRSEDGTDRRAKQLCLTPEGHLVVACLVATLGGCFGFGMFVTLICALIADVVPREMRWLAMGCYNTCIYVGMMLCSVSMGMVIKGEGFRLSFFLSGAVGGIVLLLFRFMYRR